MATKAELMGLPDDLERRLYSRWKETRWDLAGDIAGLYDPCDLTDADARALVRELDPELVAELAFGPMPEPRCNVCMTLNRERYWGRNVIIAALLDYHDFTQRDGSARPWQKGGPEAYRRCVLIYNQARIVRGEELIAA